jgi:hypothetical protein
MAWALNEKKSIHELMCLYIGAGRQSLILICAFRSKEKKT